MNKIICDYKTENLNFIRENEDFILRFDSYESFRLFIEDRRNISKRYHYVVKMQYSSLSQFEIIDSLKYINADLIFCNLGDKVKVLTLIDKLRSLQLHIYLLTEDPTNYASLKFLSSLGVDCGLWFEENAIVNDEDFIDLASYHFMSPANHAHIEPFAYIGSHIQDERNISLNELFLRGEETYELDNNNNLVNVVTKKILCGLSEYSDNIQQKDSTETKMHYYYRHFMDLDCCAKCKSFRICCGSLKNKLKDCENTMNEILDYVVLSSNVQRNNM